MSLALAIVSIVLLIPLTAIMLGTVSTLGGGITAALVGIGVIGILMVLINVLFNYLLFHEPAPSQCDAPPGVQPVSPTEIDRGNTGRPRIALAFDAGGPADPTARILDILARHQVHVTFFVTGDWATQNPDLVRRIHAEGHESGPIRR